MKTRIIVLVCTVLLDIFLSIYWYGVNDKDLNWRNETKLIVSVCIIVFVILSIFLNIVLWKLKKKTNKNML
ncbi:hypothetical protein RRG49_04560 [Mycoplasmopsis felis]|uniref:hypothetical protein n=1 Tax=Mycoplasmopsis felis TaxID=33923 RepID=UPI0022868E12|nr:hypothetical protein [Mycoplasmopsis felis]WAM02273.1 hypothetical protein ONA02_06910 [Mycoplasmopsis felis]WAM02670.1 hypothetical protein ONA02_02475 [Mycoplasmopsis felis]WQQ09193.1 hypothetical protein RRG41_03605 [Mycoplasmopsis felis]WQQ09504.1 hypothetical protein RRG41_01030 [Mycoplasmopsis felis]WQQ09688.1 hypothetical protein RRG41_02010 [Mycoplasmopsis felis]